MNLKLEYLIILHIIDQYETFTTNNDITWYPWMAVKILVQLSCFWDTVFNLFVLFDKLVTLGADRVDSWFYCFWIAASARGSLGFDRYLRGWRVIFVGKLPLLHRGNGSSFSSKSDKHPSGTLPPSSISTVFEASWSANEISSLLICKPLSISSSKYFSTSSKRACKPL